MNRERGLVGSADVRRLWGLLNLHARRIEKVERLATTVIPTGAIMPYGGTSAPLGWLLCDGTAVSRTLYASLFSVIGTSFGVGDGSTTFGLPDLRGRVPVGLDNIGGSDAGVLSVANTLGGTGGAENHTLTKPEIPGNNITVMWSVDVPQTGTARRVQDVGGVTGGSGGSTGTFNATGGSGGSHNNMQPYVLLGYIVKV